MVFLDAIVVKVRDNHVVQNKPAYLAIGDRRRRREARAGHLAGQDPAGGRDRRGGRPVLGQRHDRPAQPRRPDILIACCDGLAGFEDAITAAFPHTVVQRCVVHLVSNALRPVARRDAAAVAAELRKIYTAPTPTPPSTPWPPSPPRPGAEIPAGRQGLGRRLGPFTPFLAFTPAVRKLLYTTNASRA